MPIIDIKEDLQKRDSQYAKRKREETIYDEELLNRNYSNVSEQNAWQKVQDRFFNTKARAIITGTVILGILTVILISTVMIVRFQNSFFQEQNVFLSVDAPKSINSNQLTEITFTYENQNRASLSNAEIKISFGKYFVPVKDQENLKMTGVNNGVITIGNITSFYKGKVKIAGYFVGPEKFLENIEGKLNYQPEKTSATYSTTGKGVTVITSSPIVIDFESPEEIVTGSDLDLKITCTNTSRQEIKNIKLVIDYPETFTFKNVNPSFVQDKVWFIDTLPAQGKEEFSLRGILAGDIGTFQKFKAQVETQATQDNVIYASNEYSPTIITPPIALSQKASTDIVYPGETIQYTVKFTNTSKIPIRDAILNLTFDSQVLDFEKLNLDKKGSFNEENKTITWKASDVKSLKLLEPNDSGEVSFSVNLKSDLSIREPKDTNFTIETKAFIDSEDIPTPVRSNKTILTNSLLVKVGTYVPFSVTGKYKSGELPPKVGNETVYTLTMEVGSYSNDLKNTEIFAVLPTGVVWKGNVKGDKKDNLNFNERSNTLDWKIGGVTHGDGVFSPTQKISFDVAINPSSDQINKEVVLIKEIILNAEDVFTGETISLKNNQKTTNLDTDDENAKGKGNVIE